MKEFLHKIKELKPTQLIIPVVIFVLFLGTIVGIIRYQQNVKLKKAPKLEIVGPADGAEVFDAQIVVQGKTNSKNKVSVNNKETKVDSRGDFYAETPLSFGRNDLLIIAENKAGTKNEVIRTVIRKEPGVSASAQPEVVSTSSNQATTGVTTSAAPSGDGKGNLTSSGPENFWIPEAMSISGAIAAWMVSRKRFKQTIRK